MRLHVNGTWIELDDVWVDETLLSALREALGLVGAKFGCGAGLCGACTVLVDGRPQRACLLTAGASGAARIETIEGLARGDALHPVQQAWLDASVPQCGYCQAGQVMATVALLRVRPRPDDADIDTALAGHLCRCGTQQRIRDAVHRAAEASRGRA
ncbi:MAG: (2Fe-2S)-binding protein [Burkholderiales bacterium]|nr:MAG: (2Fe-2S)-binding protein [Burkholderiales bacterium]